MNYTLDEKYFILRDYVNVSPEVISCMTAVNGENSKTYMNILYWATGYNDFYQYMEENGFEF